MTEEEKTGQEAAEEKVEAEQPPTAETAAETEPPPAAEQVAESETPPAAEEKEAKKPKAAKASAAETEAPAERAKQSAAVEGLIATIKSMSVLDLAELIKALETEFGVSAAAPVAVAAAAAPAGSAAAAASASEEQTEFTVILKDIGANKINVIKAVRELTALGLKESKDLVEGAPKPVREGVSKEEAAVMKGKLEAAGATAEIK